MQNTMKNKIIFFKRKYFFIYSTNLIKFYSIYYIIKMFASIQYEIKKIWLIPKIGHNNLKINQLEIKPQIFLKPSKKNGD